MLPLALLRTSQGHPMLVELKNGDTYNGRLELCDNWMNIKLKEVIWTSRDGDRFWKLPEVYVRGASIKYMTIPDEVLEMVAEQEEGKEKRAAAGWRGGRGTRGGRGRLGGRGGGGDRGGGRGGGGRGRGDGGRGGGAGGGRGAGGRGDGGRGDGARGRGAARGAPGRG